MAQKIPRGHTFKALFILCDCRCSDNEGSLKRMLIIITLVRTFPLKSLKYHPVAPSPKCECDQTGLLNEDGGTLKTAEFLCKCEAEILIPS